MKKGSVPLSRVPNFYTCHLAIGVVVRGLHSIMGMDGARVVTILVLFALCAVCKCPASKLKTWPYFKWQREKHADQ